MGRQGMALGLKVGACTDGAPRECFHAGHTDDGDPWSGGGGGVCGRGKGYARPFRTPRPSRCSATASFWTCTWPWSMGKASVFEGTLRIHDHIHRVGASRSFDQTSWFCQEL